MRCLPLLGLTALTAAAVAAPVPKAPTPAVTILVLDDSDRDFRGKDKYADGLTALDTAGNVKFRVSGLNNCQSIGSSHHVAGDSERGHVWVAELVGHRLLRFDREGKEKLAVPDVKANSLAVDPETGNVWVIVSDGTIHGKGVEVYDPTGAKVASYPVAGFDICYDPKGKAFWLAGKQLVKVSAANGNVLVKRDVAVWCASSLAVHPETGQVWVAVREHSQVTGSFNRLLSFDAEGKERFAAELGEDTPFKVSVDPKTGDGWVTILNRSVRRYAADGKLTAEHKLPGALTAVAPGVGGDVWVVTKTETVRLTAAGQVVHRVKHEKETGQAWVAAY